jgi:hypothetical protein
MSFWKRLGSGNREEDVKPEEFGSFLYSCAARWAHRDAETEASLDFIKAKTINMDYFIKELEIVTMYAAMNAVMGKIKAQDKAHRVLDAMNDAFVNRWNPEDRQKIRLYVGFRYGEYENAQSEKRGPSPLWPLSHHIMKNLLGKETIEETPLDAVTMTHLAGYYSATIIGFNGMLENIKSSP